MSLANKYQLGGEFQASPTQDANKLTPAAQQKELERPYVPAKPGITAPGTTNASTVATTQDVKNPTIVQAPNYKGPRLYKVYGKSYNFDDFQRSADEGLSDYIFSLRRGERDQTKFAQAYSDLMTGIADGSITYDNGRYHDSKGRYFNDDNPDRDYYGLIANYLRDKQAKSQEIDTSYDPYKEYTKLLTKELFNTTDVSDVTAFFDLDPLDEKTGNRPRTNRIAVLKKAILSSMAKIDPKYTVEERNNLINSAQAAVNALEDGTIDSGDFYTLQKLAGLPFSKLLVDKRDGPSKEEIEAAALKKAQEALAAQQGAAGTAQTTTTDATGTATTTPTATTASRDADIVYMPSDLGNMSKEDIAKLHESVINLGRERYKEALKKFNDAEFKTYVKNNFKLPTKEDLKNYPPIMIQGNNLLGTWQTSKVATYLKDFRDVDIENMILDLYQNKENSSTFKNIKNVLRLSLNLSNLNSYHILRSFLDYYSKYQQDQGNYFPVILIKGNNKLSQELDKKNLAFFFDPQTGKAEITALHSNYSGLAYLYNKWGKRGKFYSGKRVSALNAQNQPQEPAQTQTQQTTTTTPAQAGESTETPSSPTNEQQAQQATTQVPSKAPGGTLQYSNIYSKGSDVGYNTYLNKVFNNDRVVDWMRNKYTTPASTDQYASMVKRNVDTRAQYKVNDYNNGDKYTPTEGIRQFNSGYQNHGDTLNYTLFGNSLEDYNKKTNGAAYDLTEFSRPSKVINTGDSFRGDKEKDYIDNALGLQTYSRVYSLTDPSLTRFGNWGQHWKSLGNTGAYYYVAPNDTSGRGQWIPTKDPNMPGYKPFDLEGPKVEVPEQPQPEVADPNKESIVTPTLQKPKSESYVSDVVARARALALPLSRVGYSIHTNNSVARTIDKALNPSLINPLDIYSPVTGAFTEKQMRNSQAADVNRLAHNNASSDAQINLAARQEGNKQGTELQSQGFLADDQRIRETQKFSFENMVKSKQNRWDVANTNSKELQNTIRQRAELEAQRQKSNWQSWDNYLAEEEKLARQSYLEDKARRDQFKLQAAQLSTKIEVENALRSKKLEYQEWKKLPANATKSSTEYPKYNELVEAQNQANYWEQVNLLGAQAKLYGYQYQHPLLGKKLTFGRGGKIPHSAEYLIYKTIKNALNS